MDGEVGAHPNNRRRTDPGSTGLRVMIGAVEWPECSPFAGVVLLPAPVADFDADITVFRAETVIDRATYDDPRQHPPGIEWVIVNGQVVVEKGVHTGARPGRTVRNR